MKILAIDPGTKTGWALTWPNGRLMEFGVEDFSAKRGESRGMVFLNMRHWLTKMLTDRFPKVELVAYEKPFAKGQAAREIEIGMMTRIEEVCEDFEIDYAFIYPTSLKKWATGKGNSGKDIMLKEARKRYSQYGIEIENYDEADALLILAWANEEKC